MSHRAPCPIPPEYALNPSPYQEQGLGGCSCRNQILLRTKPLHVGVVAQAGGAHMSHGGKQDEAGDHWHSERGPHGEANEGQGRQVCCGWLEDVCQAVALGEGAVRPLLQAAWAMVQAACASATLLAMSVCVQRWTRWNDCFARF